jgi:hypothetical protein
MEEEAQILSDAHDLTTGATDDPQKVGRVLEWMAKRLIEMESLLRASIEHTSRCQLVENCLATHAQKKWIVRLFGYSYSLPATVAVVVVGVLIWLGCRKHGIM